jgi:hypothetical protein
VATERITSTTKLNGSMANMTCDLPACSIDLKQSSTKYSIHVSDNVNSMILDIIYPISQYPS